MYKMDTINLDLNNSDFINIACNNRFKKYLVHKFILRKVEEQQSIKEQFEHKYFGYFEHEIFWATHLHLNHIIITKTNSDYFKAYKDKIKENYDLLTNGDIVMAVSKKDIEIKNTIAKRDNIELLTNRYKKDKGIKKYIVSTTLPYDCV